MSRIKVKFYKKIGLPSEPEANSLYFIDNDDVAEIFVTDADGVIRKGGNTDLVAAMIAGKADIEFVNTEIAAKADINSPELTGMPTAPTADPETSTGQIATTEFVQSVVDVNADARTPMVRVTGSDTTRGFLEGGGPDPYLQFTDVPEGIYMIRGLLHWESEDRHVGRILGWKSGSISIFGMQSGRYSPADPIFVTVDTDYLDASHTLDFSPGLWFIEGVISVEAEAFVRLDWTYMNTGPSTLKQGSYLTLERLVDAT
ncbi:MAG: hypothetical protein IPM50_09155 [Acidobacteriota bacterium]|nr:MAG: hypothetical protein IPM50_09155 [Acidobacteriota bacterium]